jgi:5-amino-6-(5-phosphoribosylamino)uracil reductase
VSSSSFATPPPPSPRPRVLINFASSLDGKINPAPGRRTGRFMMSRDREDFRRMLALRAKADAILIGATNLRADNPDLAIPEDERTARRARGEAEPLRMVVTSSGAGILPDMKIFDPARGGSAVVAHPSSLQAEARARLSSVAELIELGEDTVPMRPLLAWLWERGVRTLVCEGGGEVCAHLFAARAVDEVYLTLVPRVLGGARAPTMVGGMGFTPDGIPDPTLGSLERMGDELYLRYDFAWDAAPR